MASPAEQDLLPPPAEQPPDQDLLPPTEEELPAPPVEELDVDLYVPPTYELLNLGGKKFAPVQLSLEDIPVVRFDICENDGLYLRFFEAHEMIFERAENIGPGTFYGVPITPHPNPINPHIPIVSSKPQTIEPESFKACGHSHYRLQFYNSEDDSMMVEGLFQDYSGYQTGFRRKLKGEEWTGFFHTSDQRLPPFLEHNCEELGISGAHDKIIDIGGHVSLKEMFDGLGCYPETTGKEPNDPNKKKKKVKQSIKRPFLLCVHFFPEAARDRWLMLELGRRIKNGASPTQLCYRITVPRPLGSEILYLSPDQVWERYHNHSNLSYLVLKTGHPMQGNGAFTKNMTEYKESCALECFEEIIGDEFGLMHRIMWKKKILGMTIQEVVEAIQEARETREPGFKDRNGNRVEYDPE